MMLRSWQRLPRKLYKAPGALPNVPSCMNLVGDNGVYEGARMYRRPGRRSSRWINNLVDEFGKLDGPARSGKEPSDGPCQEETMRSTKDGAATVADSGLAHPLLLLLPIEGQCRVRSSVVQRVRRRLWGTPRVTK